MEKLYVMIVDDEPINRALLSIKLKEYKPLDREINIYEANSGLEAIALTKDLVNKQQTPSLIFMDLRMPHLDGYETTKKIKKEYKNIPIILHSAQLNIKEFHNNHKEFDDVLEKPISEFKLNQILEKYIQ